MRIEPERKLFVATRVDNKMREQLRQAAQRDQMYFDGSDERYLRVLRCEEGSFIGKLIDGGTPAASMDDIKRNLVSILNKVAPGRYKDDDLKVFALDEGEPPPEPERPSRDGDEEPRGGGNSGGGSYY